MPPHDSSYLDDVFGAPEKAKPGLSQLLALSSSSPVVSRSAPKMSPGRSSRGRVEQPQHQHPTPQKAQPDRFSLSTPKKNTASSTPSKAVERAQQRAGQQDRRQHIKRQVAKMRIEQQEWEEEAEKQRRLEPRAVSPVQHRPQSSAASWNMENSHSAPVEAQLDRRPRSGVSRDTSRRRRVEGRVQREVDALFQSSGPHQMQRRGNKVVSYGPWNANDPRPRSRTDTAFDKMFARGAFLHHYVNAGIDPMEMARQAALRRDIAAEYEWYGNLTAEDTVDDYDPSYGSMDYQKAYPEVYAQGGQYAAAGVAREGRMPYSPSAKRGGGGGAAAGRSAAGGGTGRRRRQQQQQQGGGRARRR